MFNDPRLLVVDDEEVVCQACQRVFSRQGFQVEESTDAREGLTWATERDYAAILLDIKMPTMDGIEFLEKLRKEKPDVPVTIITGYPSIPNAASAVRLGASDYITKPFTPEEITQAVQRSLQGRQPRGANGVGLALPEVEPWAPRPDEFRFWDESWFQPGRGQTVRVGAMLPRSERAAVEAARLPEVGEIVYQGLPLAGLTVVGKPQRLVPSPISGVVAAVNPVLRESLSALWEEPYKSGWIASISPTQLEQDEKNCKPRRVLLVNVDQVSAQDQSEQLRSLGCQVRVVAGWNEVAPILPDPDCDVLVIDAASFGEHGPELVGRINAAAPSMRVVVIASPGSQLETAYRGHRIFYYAVEPFADNEIIEILDTLFRSRPQGQPRPRAARPKTELDFVSSIFITNRNGKKAGLLAAGGLLSKGDGVGWHVRRKLTDQLFPIETTLGKGKITQVKILAAASMCDRLLVLLARDMGRLSGSLVRDTKGEFVSVSAEDRGKVMALVVQPDSPGGGLAGFDDRTNAALAEHIVREMSSC